MRKRHADHKRLRQLKRWLRETPAKWIDMSMWFRFLHDEYVKTTLPLLEIAETWNDYGTTACIAGHCCLMMASEGVELPEGVRLTASGKAKRWLAMDNKTADRLFCGGGSSAKKYVLARIDRAIAETKDVAGPEW